MDRSTRGLLVIPAAAFVFAAFAAAQQPDGLPTLREVPVAVGGRLDLDSGVVLPEWPAGPAAARLRADLVVGRDGEGLYLEFPRGGQAAAPDAARPDDGAWSEERVRVSGNLRAPLLVFARTDDGVARALVRVANGYGVAAALVTWAVAPSADPVFPPAPTRVEWALDGDRLEVTWRGDAQRYLVELDDGERVVKRTVDERRVVLSDVAADGVQRLVVRGLVDGAVSLPALAVRHGRRRAAERHEVSFEDRWYGEQLAAGLSLTRGEPAGADADVVFYLYGVHVPGGGVQRLGAGRECFAALSTLPEDGYRRDHDRLDHDDVLAVRLADGRRGALWLVADRRGDLRSGMRVHTLFLPDGRGRAVAAPAPGVAVATEAGGARLEWPAVDGAERYLVTAPGRRPLETTRPSVALADLPPNRVHAVEVVALSALGERSLPATAFVPTFGPEAVHRRVTLRAQRGGVVLRTAGPAEQPDLALIGGAGGSASLRFGTPHGSLPGGGREFGDFDGLGEERAKVRSSDVDRAEEGQFYVFDRDGGCACVRIVERGWPDTVVEYVWLPKPPE